MITIEKHGQVITLTRGGETFRMAASEAPRLIAALLVELGVSGTPHQQGYQLGRADGEQLGYAQRDREYVVATTKAQRAAARALLAGLPAAEVRAA